MTATIVTDLDDRQVLLTNEMAFDPFTGMSMGDILKDQGYMHLSGRFVAAEEPNANGALWTTEDLEMGLPTVAHGPLNWMHEEKRILGSITAAELVRGVPRAMAGDGMDIISGWETPPHIVADSVVWKWLWPRETALLEQASHVGQLWYSMECISENVECKGCGTKVPYIETQRSRMSRPESPVCEHMRERSAVRRFENPLFQGGGVILPPASPGWRKADLRVRERAEAIATSTHEASGVPADLWEGMMTQLVQLHSAA